MNTKCSIIIFLTLISLSYCEFKRIYNLTENEFIESSKGTKYSKIKWLMIFYTSNYKSYDKFMELLKNQIYSHFEKDKNIKFGLLDCNSAKLEWLVNLIDIKSIPFLVLVSNGRMYNYGDDVINEENIVNFINRKKSYLDSFPIPDKINVFTKGKILFSISMRELNNFFQSCLDKLNLNLKWDYKLTLIIVGIFMIIFFALEIKLIKLFLAKDDEGNEDEKLIIEKNDKKEDVDTNNKNNIEKNNNNKKEKSE